MTLSPGSRLGPYEITGPLGAGGMGEVYRARDRRLGREVAIKVLPIATSTDSTLVKRFEREAQAASSLNHPNIVTIYDFASEDSVWYIAMELVEGKRLRDVIDVPAETRRLLDIAVQIADALAKAHAAGIIHRDLKPENVMVTRDDRVKLLDFGLAKLTPAASRDNTATLDPTDFKNTTPGLVMGTVRYMSPEQVLGKEIDFRSDQFSFGTILYEMATGRHGFSRPSTPQTMTAILQDEPEPIATLNPKIPPPVRWIVERCLAKEPARRYASTEDLARELATVRDHLSEASSGSAIAPVKVRAPQRWMTVAFVAALALAAAIVVWTLQKRDYFWSNPLQNARFTRLTDWPGTERDAAISPDGKFVAFLADRDGAMDVWVTQLGSGEFRNLTKGQYVVGSAVTRNVGFFPDSALVWFASPTGKSGVATADEIWQVPTLGGTPRRFIAPAVEAAWSADRKQIVYHSNDPGDPTFLTDSSGRSPSLLFKGSAGIHNHYPAFSPDGRFVYFTRGHMGTTDVSDIWRIRTTGGTGERLTEQGFVTYPTPIDDRRLLYVAAREDEAGTGLYALDIRHRIPHPASFGLEEYTSLSSTADGGRLAASVANPSRNLWQVTISNGAVDDSTVSPFTVPGVRASAPRFGPDYVLYLSSGGRADGVWKLKNGSATELWRGSDGAVTAAPAVSPDGSEICFIVQRANRGTLYRMGSDGTAAQPLATLLDIDGARGSPSWSPDGEWVATVARERGTFPLLKVPVDGGAPIRLVGGLTRHPVWSPDGRFIIYSEVQPRGPDKLRAVTPEGNPVLVPEISIRQRGVRYRFIPHSTDLITAQGDIWKQNFYLLDLKTGHLRQLTKLGNGSGIKEFDVSPDGKYIVFDRYRENGDIVLIDISLR
jgi:serine/threonine protein kinase